MGKTSIGAKGASLGTKRASEDSQNQGFLKFFTEKATHGQAVVGPAESRKGLKSGEPFSSTNHINDSAKKGRKSNDNRFN